ncbi:AsmA family protein [Aliiglaciecola lipolytica]|uniref:AsmA domain-containing protein n=1 Tax=Aliiglaciecola lipolytica E3 TaxID=1127673 RepID=K6YZD7_9ALTE|nr:hypothetical protein [Aliiglaciecola lipolytica]GAC16580.1 hypothetical protein GLIP_3969 [Aliiglaciecola lipolytica E3]
MKKGLIVFAVIILLIAGGAWYALSGAGDFIRTQIEQQGSKYLGTTVSVASVDLALSEGRLTISDVDVENPDGFSDEDAFSLESITLDLGEVLSEPYVVQTVSINAPEVLYELDESGQGNLLVLKNNLAANLPKSNEQSSSEAGANPLLIVENVTVSNVRLKLDFEKLSTGDFEIEQKTYEITLPTFNAGPIGKPNGIPADQAGVAIVNEMLDNIIAKAKSEAKKKLEEEAKKLAKEKLEEEKDKLTDKAKDKLKGLFNKD